MKKHLIDGNDVIINKETPEQKVEEFQFAAGDVIGLDIFVSTGEGKPKEGDFRTTVFKREIDTQYNLKISSARQFFSEVNKKYPTLPFSIRSFENSTMAKVGVKECLNHDLITPYPVLVEKAGEYVAQFKCTIVVQPTCTAVLAGNIPFASEKWESDKKINNENLQALIASDLWKKEGKKKGKKTEETKEGK
jgi:methionine aminopeptidase